MARARSQAAHLPCSLFVATQVQPKQQGLETGEVCLAGGTLPHALSLPFLPLRGQARGVASWPTVPPDATWVSSVVLESTQEDDGSALASTCFESPGGRHEACLSLGPAPQPLKILCVPWPGEVTLAGPTGGAHR